MKVLLIGGTGNISTSVAKLCLERGDELWLFNRGNDMSFAEQGAHYIIGNAKDPEDLKAKLADKHFDAAVNFISFTYDDAVNTYEALKGRVGHYFFISTAMVYQKPCYNTPITADTPLKNPYSKYAQLKIKSEMYFLERYREDDFPVTIVRPSHTYGEKKLVVGPTMGWGMSHWTLVDRMLKGEPVVVHDNGRTLWTVTHSDDFAWALRGLMGNLKAVGHSFHITNDEYLTWDMIMETYGNILGVKPNVAHIPGEFIENFWPGKENAIKADFGINGIFDISKLQKFVPDYYTRVPLRDGLARSIKWYMDHPETQTIDEENNRMTDALIAAWNDVIKGLHK